jgi:hypothetical protein
VGWGTSAPLARPYTRRWRTGPGRKGYGAICAAATQAWAWLATTITRCFWPHRALLGASLAWDRLLSLSLSPSRRAHSAAAAGGRLLIPFDPLSLVSSYDLPPVTLPSRPCAYNLVPLPSLPSSACRYLLLGARSLAILHTYLPSALRPSSPSYRLVPPTLDPVADPKSSYYIDLGRTYEQATDTELPRHQKCVAPASLAHTPQARFGVAARLHSRISIDCPLLRRTAPAFPAASTATRSASPFPRPRDLQALD